MVFSIDCETPNERPKPHTPAGLVGRVLAANLGLKFYQSLEKPTNIKVSISEGLVKGPKEKRGKTSPIRVRRIVVFGRTYKLSGNTQTFYVCPSYRYLLLVQYVPVLPTFRCVRTNRVEYSICLKTVG